MKVKKILLIFCQAPADIIYTLDLLSKNSNRKCIIYVCNVKAIHTYLLSLKLNAEVLFLEKIVLSFYSIKSLVNTKKKIKTTLKSFKSYKGAEVYFFSTSYDFFTAAIVKDLSKANSVTYFNHYDHLTYLQGSKSFSLKRIIQSKIYQYITGAKFLAEKEVNFPKFDYSKFDIIKIDIDKKPDVASKYLFKPNTTKESVLLFLSPEEFKSINEEGQEKVIHLIEELKKLYSVYLKGHPRLGEPELLVSLVNEKIEKILPSECIDYSSFKFVVGLTSAALCYPAEKELSTVVSLLEFVTLRNTERQIGFKTYIDQYSKNKIIYDYTILK